MVVMRNAYKILVRKLWGRDLENLRVMRKYIKTYLK
jgi:hypothetical protein